MDDAAVWRIAEWLRETIRFMVDSPDAVVVMPVPQPSGVVLVVTVAKTDFGKVIGQTGRTARSLRIILTAMAMKHGGRIGLDFRESGQA
jgi:predicted RNA-binding protein YlqC (UPF0109 family)